MCSYLSCHDGIAKDTLEYAVTWKRPLAWDKCHHSFTTMGNSILSIAPGMKPNPMTEKARGLSIAFE